MDGSVLKLQGLNSRLALQTWTDIAFKTSLDGASVLIICKEVKFSLSNSPFYNLYHFHCEGHTADISGLKMVLETSLSNDDFQKTLTIDIVNRS